MMLLRSLKTSLFHPSCKRFFFLVNVAYCICYDSGENGGCLYIFCSTCFLALVPNIRSKYCMGCFLYFVMFDGFMAVTINPGASVSEGSIFEAHDAERVEDDGWTFSFF